MQSLIEKIDEVKLHFENKDIHLGFRRLVDCVLDTQDVNHFISCIQLNEWKESAPRTDEALIAACIVYLDTLKTVALKAPSSSSFLVRVDNVEKKYPRGGFELGPIAMEINYGEVWGLVGENGNGKTTLLRILAKDLSYESGSVDYGLDFSASSNYELRTSLAYVAQRTPRWFGSVKMNLKLTATHYGIMGDENEVWVMMMIIRFGLYAFRNHNWSELSSGYKMRFELARTFLRKPKLLLLDEPLANLDILAQQIILEDLRFLAKSISNPLGIVLSSQQLFEVEKISDRIIFLKNGAPTLLHDKLITLNTPNSCVVELEITATREQLQTSISSLNILQFSYNGGQYIIEFENKDGINALLSCLINSRIPMKYIRDISTSSRRLFT
jgi:ABC-2 type transport system ATP-binding protein